jgi:hypothetical protein
VIFDPFGDFQTQGYLRNHDKEKDIDIVRRLEHSAFITGLDGAISEDAAPRLRRPFSAHTVFYSMPSIRGQVKTDGKLRLISRSAKETYSLRIRMTS